MAKGGKLGAFIQAVLAGIAQGAKMFGGGVKWVWKQSTALASRVWPFGRNGAIPQPPEMELVEEKEPEQLVPPHLAAQADTNDFEPEVDSPEVIARALGEQKPGQTSPYGIGAMEPWDVLNYAKADSIEKREKIANGMRKNTRNWLMDLNGKQLDALANASVGAVTAHLSNAPTAGNKPHVPGLPRLPFGKNYKGKDLKIQAPAKPEAPAVDQSQFDVSLGMKMAANELQPKGPMSGIMDGFENAAMDRRRAMEAEDRELEETRGFKPKRLAGMKR